MMIISNNNDGKQIDKNVIKCLFQATYFIFYSLFIHIFVAKIRFLKII